MGLVATIELTALMSYCIDRISVKIGATLCRDTVITLNPSVTSGGGERTEKDDDDAIERIWDLY